jgi:hypothetical protein
MNGVHLSNLVKVGTQIHLSDSEDGWWSQKQEKQNFNAEMSIKMFSTLGLLF